MYSPEIREAILQRIADGESLRAICADDDMPGKATVFEWLEADEQFRTKYASARARQADLMVDSFGDIEESVLSGVLKPDAAKVVLWSRQWRAAKLRPKVYGDKIETTHELGDSVKEIVRTIVRAP
jgi:hypothetical protein